MPQSKIILDLCGGTGSWSKPYKDAGYDVRLITLPDHDVLTYVPPSNVYGVLAAPPCTEFSVAKANNPRDFAGGMEIVEACLRIIWKCRVEYPLKFWALENPRGFLRQFIGKPPYTFEQWQYGANQSKPTDLWGYYKIPRSTITEKPPDMMYRFANGSLNGKDWKHPKCPPEYAEYVKQFKDQRAALRAITPPGFAKAFFEANQ